MYILEKDLKFPKDSFKSMVGQPYELKPSFSMKRVLEWYQHWDGLVYISFSGGLDSTVLAYIVCQAYMKYQSLMKDRHVILVFSDTGIEFPELRKFTTYYTEWLQNKFPELSVELTTLKPEKGHTFKDVCENYGFPIISKENATKIRKLRNGKLSDRYRNYLLNGDERGKFGMLPKKWQFLVNKEKIKFTTSEKCCDEMKKRPFKKYHKETGRYPFIGITQDESFQRENQYNHTGCNVYDGDRPKSQPLGFWTKQDILKYVVQENIPICSVYGEVIQNEQGIYRTTGEQRTGCVCCGFGCHLEKEPNRIQRLSISHPSMYKAAMRCTNNGVTYKEALEQCGIPTETWESIGQMSIFDVHN